jgi:hypothetical protein
MVIVALAQGAIEAQTANGNVPQDSVCKVPKDEIEVFAGFLKDKSIPQVKTVLVTETNANDVDMDKNIQILKIGKHEIPSEMPSDFNSKNDSSCLIGHFGGVRNLNFISKAEEDRLFQTGSDEFHKKYGGDALIVTFSRVGFNSDKTLAFLHVSVGVDHVAGSGTLYLLKRNGGTWTIALKVEITLSPGNGHP